MPERRLDGPSHWITAVDKLSEWLIAHEGRSIPLTLSAIVSMHSVYSMLAKLDKTRRCNAATWLGYAADEAARHSGFLSFASAVQAGGVSFDSADIPKHCSLDV